MRTPSCATWPCLAEVPSVVQLGDRELARVEQQHLTSFGASWIDTGLAPFGIGIAGRADPKGGGANLSCDRWHEQPSAMKEHGIGKNQAAHGAEVGERRLRPTA